MYKPWRAKGFFQFEIINVLGSLSVSFNYLSIILWVYGHYNILLFQYGDRLWTSESVVYRCQIHYVMSHCCYYARSLSTTMFRYWVSGSCLLGMCNYNSYNMWTIKCTLLFSSKYSSIWHNWKQHQQQFWCGNTNRGDFGVERFDLQTRRIGEYLWLFPLNWIKLTFLAIILHYMVVLLLCEGSLCILGKY